MDRTHPDSGSFLHDDGQLPALLRDVQRVLTAWDMTTHRKNADGQLLESMENLRETSGVAAERPVAWGVRSRNPDESTDEWDYISGVPDIAQEHADDLKTKCNETFDVVPLYTRPRGVIGAENDALRTENYSLRDELTKDYVRLKYVSRVLGDIGGENVHEEASINASAFGRLEPNDGDYVAAVRTVLDAAIAKIRDQRDE